MKSVLATLIGLIAAASLSTASAHVVVVTASIPVATAFDESDLQAAFSSAIDDALTHAIGFTPTAMTLRDGCVNRS